MKTARDLMNEGDFRAAAERLRAKLAVSPGDEQSKLLLGTCLHLLGDDEAFMRIDDELSQSPTAKSLPAWPMYHGFDPSLARCRSSAAVSASGRSPSRAAWRSQARAIDRCMAAVIRKRQDGTWTGCSW